MDAGSERSSGSSEGSVGEQSGDPLALPEPRSERYPDYRMPFVGQQELGPDEVADAVEQFLLGYGYQTARAYRADLEDIYAWATERGLAFMTLSDDQFRRYQTLLRRRKYSEGTIRRRGTAYAGLRRSWGSTDLRSS